MSSQLDADSLLQTVFNVFKKIPDPKNFSGSSHIRFSDHLMSGLAIFGLKFPSLLNYDRTRKNPPIEHNLKTLYHILNPPSDTYMRERLDPLNPSEIRPAFKKIFANFQRAKQLEKFVFIDDCYLLSMDGTGQFMSSEICCKHCCRKEHANGKVSYYHQMFGACIVHPDISNVIPLCPEIIQNEDGNTKNDCERNAAKRFIQNFRREHPHLKVIVVEDGLASNKPHIEMLEEHDMRYILGAKPGDHKFLFDLLEESEETVYHSFKDEQGSLHQFRFLNQVSLNKSHPDLKVNILEYRETTKKGKEINFSWVTNIKITKENAYTITRGGRARWKIENETYNTLKNLGYNFEHSYGHGKEYLSTVFCYLMMLSFLIDQVLQISCTLFKEVRIKTFTYRDLWAKMRTLFDYVPVDSWEVLWLILTRKKALDTS